MTISHHGIKYAEPQGDITVNAEVVDRQYYWNTNLSKWDNVFFKILPGYTDSGDLVAVLPTSPNGGYPFIDTQDTNAEIVCKIFVDGVEATTTTKVHGFLNASTTDPAVRAVYGNPTGTVPTASGTYTYELELRGINTRGETASQFFNISFTRT